MPRFTFIKKTSEQPILGPGLSIDENEALVAWIDTSAVTSEQRTKATQALRKAQELGAWIKDQREHESVVFTVVEKRGRMHLREFSRSRESKTEAATDRRLPRWTNTVLDFHHAFGFLSESQGDASGHVSGGGESEHARTMGSFLLELIHRAKLNEWSLPSPTRQAQKQRLHNAAMGFKIAAGIPIADHLYDYTPSQRRIAEKYLRTATDWPANSRPYALFLSVLETIEEDERGMMVHDSRSKIELLGQLSVIGTNTDRAIFLGLNTLSTSAQQLTNRYGPIHGAAIRIASPDCWVPVESNPEAIVFELLREYQSGLYRQGSILNIRKPVWDEEIAGTQLRPDFWIELNGAKAVVEVMGFNDPAYRNRKETMKALIETTTKWFEIDASDPTHFAQELKRFEIELGAWIASGR